jgi:hypothetical protein
MLLSEAVDEVLEKSPAKFPMQSIIRKIDQVRNRLLRMYGKDIVPYRFDLLEGQAEYPWPLPMGAITNVLVQGVKYDFGQLNAYGRSRYYYFLNSSIGIYPTPAETIPEGVTVFYKRTLAPLTVNDLNGEVGFDTDYDMLVVYGALKDIAKGNEAAEYSSKYDDLLSDFLRAGTTPEPYQIQVGDW